MKSFDHLASRRLIEKLKGNELVVAMMVRGARTPDVVRCAASTGHQSVIVDLEHSTMTLDVVAQMVATANDLGLVPFVRVPERDYGTIGRVLDAGARGIVAARIETAEQAEEVARACRFAPRGQRSQIGLVPQLGFKPTSPLILNPLLDQSVIVQILVETPRGVLNAGAIAAVDGVDMLAIGANDLAAELGLPGEFRSKQMRDAVNAVASACARNEKICVLGGISDLKIMADYLALGVAPMIMSGSDIDMLVYEASRRAEAVKDWHSEFLKPRSDRNG